MDCPVFKSHGTPHITRKTASRDDSEKNEWNRILNLSHTPRVKPLVYNFKQNINRYTNSG